MRGRFEGRKGKPSRKENAKGHKEVESVPKYTIVIPPVPEGSGCEGGTQGAVSFDIGAALGKQKLVGRLADPMCRFLGLLRFGGLPSLSVLHRRTGDRS